MSKHTGNARMAAFLIIAAFGAASCSSAEEREEAASQKFKAIPNGADEEQIKNLLDVHEDAIDLVLEQEVDGPDGKVNSKTLTYELGDGTHAVVTYTQGRVSDKSRM